MRLAPHQQRDENRPQLADFSQFAIRNSLFSEETTYAIADLSALSLAH
jgi:hypothetical protein